MKTVLPHRDDTPVGRYREFLDKLPAALYRSTLEGRLVYCNLAFATLFGYESTLELVDFPIANLYRNKRDRGEMIAGVMSAGRIYDWPIAFQRKDGSPIWCAVTARAVHDDDGLIVHLDGVVRDITAEIEKLAKGWYLNGSAERIRDPVLTLDLKGRLLDANGAAVDLMGAGWREAFRQIPDTLPAAEARGFFNEFLGDVVKSGHGECIVSIRDAQGVERPADLQAVMINHADTRQIKIRIRKVAKTTLRSGEQSDRDKLQGVLELAGGVSHTLNQPLTIINNLLGEVMADLKSDDRNYPKILKIHAQIEKLNRIVKKIGSIKKYEAIDYVAGIKIVDIDKAS
jgi:PAS domain S-box-containing protein